MSLISGGRYSGNLHAHLYLRDTPAVKYRPRKAKKSVKGSAFFGAGVPLNKQRVTVSRFHRAGPPSRYNQFVKAFFAKHPAHSVAEARARMKDAAAVWKNVKRE